MVESFPPAQAIRALSLHDHRFRIAVPSDVDAERRLAVAGEDRTPATPSTPTGRARRRWRSASSSGPDRGRLVIRSPVMLSPAWVAMSTSAPSTSASEVDAPCSGSLPPRACSKASTAASLSRSITSKLRPVRSPMLARGLAITMPCQTRKDWRTSAGSFVRGPGGDEVRHGEANWGSRHGLIELSFEGIGLFSSHHFDAGPVRAQLRELRRFPCFANRCVGFRTID